MNEIITYLKARYPILGIAYPDERAIEQVLADVARTMNMELRLWSCASAFTRPDPKTGVPTPSPKPAPPDGRTPLTSPLAALAAIGACPDRALYVMRDFGPFLVETNPAAIPVVRTLRELGRALKGTGAESMRALVLTGTSLAIPDALRAEVALLPWNYPKLDEMTGLVREMVTNLRGASDEKLRAVGNAVTDADVDRVAQAALGLSLSEADNCVARSIVAKQALDPATVMAEKRQAVSRSGLLDWYEPERTLADVGGLEQLKDWIVARERATTPEARAYGLPRLKGVLLTGVQGCGKSEAAKAIAACWRRPLLRADIGRLFGGLVGQSEQNTRTMIATAEAVAPCVLWLDEVEKALGGAMAGGGAGDSGTAMRVFGTILTFMQESKADVFLVATANNVEMLPPEFIRKGRFDEIFFVDLPHAEERRAIWRVMACRYAKQINGGLDRLVEQSAGFSGAEIESIVVAALYRAFDDAGRDPTTEDYLAETAACVPLSKTASEKIAAIREWARGRARPASRPEEARPASGLRATQL